MSTKNFTTADCAAHVAQYLHAQPVAPRTLSLDERIDQLKAELLAAKAENDQATIERLRGVWAKMSAEIEAAEAAPVAALPPLDICPICKEVRDDLGRCGCDYTIYIDLDCLIAAHEAQEDTKAQQSAWEYLSEISSVTMRGTSYRIPSAKWSDTTYTTTATNCDCPARKRCWHQHAASTLDLARENEAIDALAECWA